jgi:hypothetical protein
MTADEYKKQFADTYGYDLEDSSVLPDEGITQSKKVERFLLRVTAIIDAYIVGINPNHNYANLTAKQIADYNNALLEQGYYMLKAGDVSLMSGFDPVTNALINIDDLRRRTVAPLAISYLTRSSICYRGISTHKIREELIW